QPHRPPPRPQIRITKERAVDARLPQADALAYATDAGVPGTQASATCSYRAAEWRRHQPWLPVAGRAQVMDVEEFEGRLDAVRGCHRAAVACAPPQPARGAAVSKLQVRDDCLSYAAQLFVE